MTTATATYTYTLIKVYDLREYVEDIGYIAIPEEEMHECDRCGKRHNKVYVVERNDGATSLVGRECCKVYKWSPELIKRFEREELHQVKAQARQKKQAEIEAKQAKWQAALEMVNKMPLPEIVQVGIKQLSRGPIPVYGVAGSRASMWCPEGLTEERRRGIISSWKNEQAAKLLEA